MAQKNKVVGYAVKFKIDSEVDIGMAYSSKQDAIERAAEFCDTQVVELLEGGSVWNSVALSSAISKAVAEARLE